MRIYEKVQKKGIYEMKLRKILAAALAGAMLLGTVTACGEKKENVFTVGFDQDFPPYGYVAEDGSYTGFDIEMATECAKRMGMEIKLQPIDWDSKDPDILILRYTEDARAKEDKVFDRPELMKAPIVRNGKQATVGYAPEVWETWK